MDPSFSEKAIPRTISVLLYSVPVVLALAGPALFWDQGCIEREALTFVRQYTDARPVMNKVFDPHVNDLGTYQARELSYLLDLLDANAYAILAAIFGIGFSIPLSALAASLLLVVIFLWGARSTTVNVDPVTVTALLACFVTSFGFVSTMGLFYRSAKPMLAAVVLAWLFVVRRMQQNRRRRSKTSRDRLLTRDAMIPFTLGLIGGLLDRQGFYLVVAACVILTVHYRLTGQLRDVLCASVSAAIVLQLYNLVFAPLAIRSLNGYWPEFSYQMIPLAEMTRLPNHMLRASALLFENTALLLGGFQVVALTVMALVCALAWRRMAWPSDLRHPARWWEHLQHNAPSRVVAYCVLALGLHIVMFGLMIGRHGYVYRWMDHRYWYYTIPFLASALFGLLLALEGGMAHLPRHYRRLIPVALVIVALSNGLSLTHYRQIMTRGEWFGPVHTQCTALKASLRRGVAEPGLDPEYRAFFDHLQRPSPK